MNSLIVIVLILFTQVGPGYIAKPFPGTFAECQEQAAQASSLVGTKLPGPNGEMVTVLDAQSECRVYDRHTEVKN